MNFSPYLLLFVLITSHWSWEIFSFNFYLLSLIWIASILLYISFLKSSKKFAYFFCLLMILILVVQWKTTNNANLFYMDSTYQYNFNTRRGELSSFNFNILEKNITVNSGRFLENKLTFMLYKLQQNFFRSLDLNLYFFGGHPREREGVREFEKFSFLSLPFFLLGLVYIVKHRIWQIILSLFIPLIVVSVIGHDNYLSLFSLFPFFAVTITIGAIRSVRKILKLVSIKKVSKKYLSV